MHRHSKSAAIALIAALVPLSAARAAPVLDQEFVAFSAGFRFTSVLPVAQTFTVGVDGLLDRVEAQVFRDPGSSAGNITLSIMEVSGGGVLGAVLTSVTMAVADLSITMGDFLSFDLADFEVDAGDTLAIRFTSDQPAGFSCTPACWLGESPGSYGGGTAIFGDTVTQIDFGFRTFVETDIDAVPEPAALALFATALAGLALRRRKTRA